MIRTLTKGESSLFSFLGFIKKRGEEEEGLFFFFAGGWVKTHSVQCS